jgi:hypothetical protein
MEKENIGVAIIRWKCANIFRPSILFWLRAMATFFTRIKYIIILLLLMVIDIAPAPVLGLIALSILLFRPLWFKEMVDRLYSDVNPK